MNGSNVRIIAARECRDLLRDRRTILMIFLTPVFLYPVMGIGGYQFAAKTLEQPSVIGIVGAEALPKAGPLAYGRGALPAVAWLMPLPGPAALAGSAATYRAAQGALTEPPLIVGDRFAPGLIDPGESRVVEVRQLEAASPALESGAVDLVLVVPADLPELLAHDRTPTVTELHRPGNERSSLASKRWEAILRHWRQQLKEHRFQRAGLPTDYDEPVRSRRPDQEASLDEALATELAFQVARYLPFILVMWALAGALHPAIDLTAGEKERGTLETLLLSPALRTEIVAGKFLAVWAFSTASAMWNLSGLGFFIVAAHFALPGFEVLRIAGLACGAVFVIVLAALFSAVSIALGAYARSAKEGQYYLLPLFFVVMPLAFLPLAPGVELDWFTSLVPVTGATLLLQKLMTQPLDEVPWRYFPVILIALLGWSALALAWAVHQFHREAVLFREAEGFSWSAWLRRRITKPQ